MSSVVYVGAEASGSGGGGGVLPLVLPATTMSPGAWGLYTLWKTAPISCGGKGWALLGETGTVGRVQLGCRAMQRCRATTCAGCKAARCLLATSAAAVSRVVFFGAHASLSFRPTQN